MTSLEFIDIKTIAELPFPWERLNGKCILISGGTGFIGSFFLNVVRYRCAKYGNKIKIISLSRGGGMSDDVVEYIKTDITVPFLYDSSVDYILHLASNTHPKQYGEDPVGTITTNIIGCNNLLKLAVENNSIFLFTSSVEIYGQGTEIPMDETYCGYIDCNTFRAGYNEAKRTCESLCQSYRKQYGLEVKIVRLARIFGADKKKDTKVMSQFMDKAVAGEDIILKSKGNQKFSYCYIADAVSGILKVLFDGKNGEAYNISDDDEGMTLGDYAEFIAGLAGRHVYYKIENDESTSKALYALLDCSKIKKLGWESLYTVSKGLERTYKIKSKKISDMV